MNDYWQNAPHPGSKPLTREELCEYCGGEGKIRDFKLYPTGPTIIFDTCWSCDGSGEKERE